MVKGRGWPVPCAGRPDHNWTRGTSSPARRACTQARDHYYVVLREALDCGVRQTDLAKALNLTRETIFRDSLTPEERAELYRHRRAAAARRAAAQPLTHDQLARWLTRHGVPSAELAESIQMYFGRTRAEMDVEYGSAG